MFTNRFGTCWLNGGFTAIDLTDEPAVFETYSHVIDGPGVDATIDGKLTVKVPGYAWGGFNISFNGEAGVIYYASIRENGVANDFVNSVEGIASGGRVNLSLFVGGRPNEGDVLQVYMWSNSASTQITPVSAQFWVFST